jgi:flavin reductase ActVB
VITAGEYRDAMTRIATGVTIVTTSDASGRWWGLTASSFTPLSIDPPLILVCIALDAHCHQAFATAQAFRVNVLGVEHERLAARFATRGTDKFAGGEFRADENGLPVLPDAPLGLRCRTVEQRDLGDHTILVASVEETRVLRDGSPLVHADRRYWDLVGGEVA